MLQLIEALILLSILPTTWFFTGGWNTPSPFEKYTGNAWKMAYVIERERKTPDYWKLPWHEQRQVTSHYKYEFDGLSMKQRRAWGREWERRRGCSCKECMSTPIVIDVESKRRQKKRKKKMKEKKLTYSLVTLLSVGLLATYLEKKLPSDNPLVERITQIKKQLGLN